MNPLQRFLSGKFDDLFKNIGSSFKGDSSKYSPIDRAKLNWWEYEKIATTDENVAVYTNHWLTLGTKYDLKVKSEQFRSESRNQNLQKDLENIISNYNYLIKSIIWQLAVKGNTMVTVNKDNKLIAQHIDFYDVYWDYLNSDYYRVDLKIDGKVVAKDLEPNKDFYHIKNPFNSFVDLGVPPIDLALEEIYTNTNLWQFLNHQASRGLTGLNIGILETMLGETPVDWEQKDEEGNSKAKKWTTAIKNWFSKSSTDKTDRLALLPFIKDIKKITSSIRDEQVLDVLNEIKFSTAKAFNLSPLIVGEGKTTYNNMEAIMDSEWDKVGKVLQECIVDVFNNFILPEFYKIETNPDFKVYVEKPQNEDQNKKEKSIVDLFSRSGDVLNTKEKREIINRVFGFDLPENFEPDQPIEPETNEPNQQEPAPAQEAVRNQKFAEKKSQKTVLDKAFKSPFYQRAERTKGKVEKKGLKPLLEKSFKRQLERTITNFKENDSLDLNKHFVKIESLLPFTVLKDNLLNFVDLARQEVEDRIKELRPSIKSSAKFNEILNTQIEAFIDALVKYNLKGFASLTQAEKTLLNGFDGDYKGIDEETSNQINTVLKEFADKPFDEVVEALVALVDTLPQNRAELIAQMTIVNTVEKTRYLEYINEGFKFKRHLGVQDSRETEFSTEASSAGVVPIDYVYRHQIGDGQAPPLHFNERSSMIYGLTEEDIS